MTNPMFCEYPVIPDTNTTTNSHKESFINVAVRIRPSLTYEDPNDVCVRVELPNDTKERFPSDHPNSSPPPPSSSSPSSTPPSSSSSPKTPKLHLTNHETHTTQTFPQLFPATTHQMELYSTCVTPLVDSCLEGINTTVMALGQKGSGKTHTLIGHCPPLPLRGDTDGNGDVGDGSDVDVDDGINDQTGILPRAIWDLFQALERTKSDFSESQPTMEESDLEPPQDDHGRTVATAPTTAVDEESPSSSIPTTTTTTTTPTTTTTDTERTTNTTVPPYEYQVNVQFLELYNDQIHDLLSQDDTSIANDTTTTSTTAFTTTTTNGVKRRPSTSHKSTRRLSTTSTNTNDHPKPPPSSHNIQQPKPKPKSKPNLTIRDNTIHQGADINNAHKPIVTSAQQALYFLQKGLYKRQTNGIGIHTTPTTNTNTTDAHPHRSSSRSHAVFTLFVQQRKRLSEVNVRDRITGRTSPRSCVEVRESKFMFVDLASSSKMGMEKPVKKRLLEGIHINKGLLVLSNVLSALSHNHTKPKNNQTHVPYRDSKLTRLLKGSLGGNHQTLLIACVPPSNSQMEETRLTLRNASRAKRIRNRPEPNIVYRIGVPPSSSWESNTAITYPNVRPLSNARMKRHMSLPIYLPSLTRRWKNRVDAARVLSSERRGSEACSSTMACDAVSLNNAAGSSTRFAKEKQRRNSVSFGGREENGCVEKAATATKTTTTKTTKTTQNRKRLSRTIYTRPDFSLSRTIDDFYDYINRADNHLHQGNDISCQTLRMHCLERLQQIETEVEAYTKQKKSVENVIKLIDKGMLPSMKLVNSVIGNQGNENSALPNNNKDILKSSEDNLRNSMMAIKKEKYEPTHVALQPIGLDEIRQTLTNVDSDVSDNLDEEKCADDIYAKVGHDISACERGDMTTILDEKPVNNGEQNSTSHTSIASDQISEKVTDIENKACEINDETVVNTPSDDCSNHIEICPENCAMTSQESFEKEATQRNEGLTKSNVESEQKSNATSITSSPSDDSPQDIDSINKMTNNAGASPWNLDVGHNDEDNVIDVPAVNQETPKSEAVKANATEPECLLFDLPFSKTAEGKTSSLKETVDTRQGAAHITQDFSTNQTIGETTADEINSDCISGDEVTCLESLMETNLGVFEDLFSELSFGAIGSATQSLASTARDYKGVKSTSKADGLSNDGQGSLNGAESVKSSVASTHPIHRMITELSFL